MIIDPAFKPLLTQISRALEASLDPLCVVNTRNEIVYVTPAMRGFLGLTGRELMKKKRVFCDLLKLSACEPDCQIKKTLHAAKAVRIDETPGTLGEAKVRVSLKATPLTASTALGKPAVVGAIVCVRDTTGDVLMQAKYHKSLQIIEDRDGQILELENKIRVLQNRLKDAASYRFVK